MLDIAYQDLSTVKIQLTSLEKPHNVRHTKDAIAMRDALKEYLNGPGAVSWQLKHVHRTGNDTD